MEQKIKDLRSKFEKELENAGIKPEKLSPQLLPDYRRKDM